MSYYLSESAPSNFRNYISNDGVVKFSSVVESDPYFAGWQWIWNPWPWLALIPVYGPAAVKEIIHMANAVFIT